MRLVPTACLAFPMPPQKKPARNFPRQLPPLAPSRRAMGAARQHPLRALPEGLRHPRPAKRTTPTHPTKTRTAKAARCRRSLMYSLCHARGQAKPPCLRPGPRPGARKLGGRGRLSRPRAAGAIPRPGGRLTCLRRPSGAEQAQP